MFEKSTNCRKYTDSVNTLVSAVAKTGTCAANMTSFSCQNRHFETPDQETDDFMRQHLAKQIETQGCDPANMEVTYSTHLIGSKEEYDAKKLSVLGMASNCAASGNDVNQATHAITAKCNPMYDMTDIATGKKVRNYNYAVHANLSTCDTSDEAMAQLEEDVKKLAIFNAKEHGYTIHHPNHLACQFSVLPQI